MARASFPGSSSLRSRSASSARSLSPGRGKYDGNSPTSHPSYYLPNSLQGCFVLWILATSSMLSAFLVLITMPARLHSERLYIRLQRYGSERIFGANLAACVYYFTGTNVVLYYDDEDKRYLDAISDSDTESAVCIANHQLYADWVYIWCAAKLFGRHGDVRIILKAGLRQLPILGWAMEKLNFIYLKRNWAEDKPFLERQLRNLEEVREPYWLLLFPEGTTYCENTYQNSELYLQKTRPDAAHPRHVLTPRATGMHACLSALQHCKAVWDMTVFYPGSPLSHKGDSPEEIFSIPNIFWKARGPREAVIYIKRIPTAEIPLERAEFDDWLLERWRKKDALLATLHAEHAAARDTSAGARPGSRKKGSLRSGVKRINDMRPRPRWNEVAILLGLWMVWGCIVLPAAIYGAGRLLAFCLARAVGLIL